MIEETVRVTRVDGATVWVEAETRSACSSCTKTCVSASLSRSFGNQPRLLSARCAASLHVAVGDCVVIGIDEGALLWGSLGVYVLPLCGLLFGGTLGVAWSGGQDGPAIAGGLVGLAIALFLARRLPWLNGPALQPQVLRRL